MNQSSKSPAPATWHRAMAADVLAAKGRAVVRVGGRQVALFHRNGRPFACNNRCPHEGYPLVEGTLDGGCVLTCNWHNWKFDLNDGLNLMGFDDLPVHAAKIVDGEVWVALTEEPAAARAERARRALRAAYDENDYERIARELGRIGRAGADPRAALADAIGWSHDRLEFGMTHAYAAAADWLALHDAPGADPATRLACLTEAVGHIAFDALRHRPYPYAKRARAWSEPALLDAIEAEDEAAAIARVRGALRAGLRLADLEYPMAKAALRHYRDFGHSLIYVQKAVALSERLGRNVDEPLALALTRSLVMAPREDKIPEFRRYAAARAAWGRPGKPRDGSIIGLGVNDALAWTAGRSASMAPEALHRDLLRAGARNLLHWDTALEGRIDNAVATNVGWLDFTHALTFGHAVGTLARRFPDLWPDGLLQMACFAGRNAAYLGAATDAPGPIGDRATFWRWATDQALDHGHRDPIFACHRIKTLFATRAEATEAAEDDVLLAALRRYLAARPKERHVRRVARQALGFVAREG